ncbi:MAG: lmo0937 family membrane protein [Gemmatimonadales bacterium]
MLKTTFILLGLWLLGIVSANTFGGFIHVLLAMAVAVALLRALQGRSQVD